LGSIFQDKKTGQRVRKVGSQPGKEGFMMVKGNDGSPYYATMAQLVPCDDAGTPDYDAVLDEPEEKDEPIPSALIDIPETRLNVNTASAEDLARRVPGLRYPTAMAIKKLQLTMPGEKFRTLEQVTVVSNRVNWDKLLRQNLLFVQ
jgi:hypothetical protein